MKEKTTSVRYCSYCGNAMDARSDKCINCGRRSQKAKLLRVVWATIGILTLVLGSYFAVDNLLLNGRKVLSAEEIYKLVSPLTVEVRVETEYGTITGTGFFNDTDGSIITNYHVVEDAVSGVVFLNNGEKYEILKLMGFDKYLDIAIIQIDYQTEKVLLKRTELLQTGETVYALGSSLGLTDSFSEGIVSANQREIAGQIFIQTTAPISHGNSGGPLIDSYGEVVGITTAGIDAGQNLNLAVPISAVGKIDCNTPLNFPGNLSLAEKTGMEKTNTTYWEWIEEPVIICDVEEKEYHLGNCFAVALAAVREKDDPVASEKDQFVYMPLSKALENGYTHCLSCEYD